MQEPAATLNPEGAPDGIPIAGDSTGESDKAPVVGGQSSQQPRGNVMKFVHASGSTPLDGYTIKRGVGAGGFGEVYFAVSDAGKEVALKRIQRNLDIELRGVRQCLNLKHHNLIALYDIRYDEDGGAWVVMEFVSGESLKDVIERNPNGMPLDEVNAWFKGLADGTIYLHDHGIVHRDLKPGNVFSDEQVIKIGDYGLSKFISCSRQGGQTESVGTFHYMAPEIGKGIYGKEIDVYALGIVLFEMLTGRVPFDGETSQEIIMKHLTADPDLSDVPQPYRDVIRRSLLKDPEKRFSSVNQMMAALNLDDEYKLAPVTAELPPVREPRSTADDQPFYIGDDNEEILFGPVHQRPSTNSNSQNNSEPIAHAVRGGCQRASRWWQHSELSTPVKLLLLAGFVCVMIPLAEFWLPISLVLGAVYLVYFGIRSLSMAVTGNNRPTESTNNNAQVARNVTDRRNWRNQVRTQLAAKPIADRVTDLTGAYLMSTVVCAVLCLLLVMVGASDFTSSVYTWNLFAWVGVSSVLASWVILTLSKLWEASDGESVRRRFVMLVAGLAIGGLTYGAWNVMLVKPEASWMQHGLPKIEVFHSMYDANQSPQLPAYMAYFGCLFFAMRWWLLADPLRRSRLSVWSIGFFGLGAWLLTELVVPMHGTIGWALPLIVATSVQLSSSWMNEEQVTAARANGRTG